MIAFIDVEADDDERSHANDRHEIFNLIFVVCLFFFYARCYLATQ